MVGRTDSKVEEKEARRRRREIFFIFLILFVLIVLTSLEFSIGRFRTGLPFNDSILFFSIININIILILLLIFLILRNVVKLVFERRRRILGAHLRNKLVAAFVILSLVPTGILFYVAWSFISRSIEMWVHVQVERALEGSLAVARTYYKSQAEDTLFFAKQIKQAMNREGILRGGQKENLREFLRLEQVAYRLDAVYLIAPDQTM
jgi:two-component system nitrogen regulation sensor histidine kinase NtrY